MPKNLKFFLATGTKKISLSFSKTCISTFFNFLLALENSGQTKKSSTYNSNFHEILNFLKKTISYFKFPVKLGNIFLR